MVGRKERASETTVEAVLVELKKIRRELQRLEDLLMEESPKLSKEEIEELIKEASDESIEWVKLEKQPKPED